MIDVNSEKLTIRQIQDETGLSYRAVQRRVTSGKIKGDLVNEVWFVPRSELSKLPRPRKPRGLSAKKDKMIVSSSNINILDETELVARASGLHEQYVKGDITRSEYATRLAIATCTAMGGNVEVPSGIKLA